MNPFARAAGGYEWAIRSARRWSAFDHAWRARERYGEVLGGRLAAAIAYYGFFAVFALGLVAYAALGFLLDNAAVFDAVDNFLRQNQPWLQPQEIQASRSAIGWVGLAGLVLTGVGWIEAIRSSQRLIFQLVQQPGNAVIRWLVDLAVLAGLLLMLGVSVAAVDAIETALGWLDGGSSAMSTVASWVLTVAVNILIAAALLIAVPRLRMSVRRLLTPVLLVGGGITLLNTLGRFFIGHSRDNVAYAVVASAVGLLLYLYLFNQVLLFGAALAATSRHGRVVDLTGAQPPG